MLTLDKIYKASHVLRSVIRKTDLIHAPLVNPDSEIYLKTENLQITGSFKVRGAYYMMSQLTEEEKARGGDCLLCRQPCTGRCTGCCKESYQVLDLPAGRCSDFQGGSNQKLWCRSLHGQRCL